MADELLLTTIHSFLSVLMGKLSFPRHACWPCDMLWLRGWGSEAVLVLSPGLETRPVFLHSPSRSFQPSPGEAVSWGEGESHELTLRQPADARVSTKCLKWGFTFGGGCYTALL